VAGDLLSIYFETLARCAPERLVRDRVPADAPHDVVAIGKAAGALLDGVAVVHRVDDAFVAIPRGYRLPETSAQVAIGGHPDMTAETFDAGRRLLDFVDHHRDILFLISGGGSACVEVPLPPHSERDLVDINARVVASDLPIGEMNTIRKQFSAIKGGRLGARVRGRSVTLVYSDVASGALADVASGPTIQAKGDAILIADNDTLTSVAATVASEAGLRATRWPSQIESHVAAAADALVRRAAQLEPGEIVVAGGEPTVARHGNGRGGRCSELAVRFALAAGEHLPRGVTALFASTDGVDGSSGAAGVLVNRISASFDREMAHRALAASDSMAVAAQIGEPIMITPTGNNLRDIFLMARG
jgi:glycerate 2-kinase